MLNHHRTDLDHRHGVGVVRHIGGDFLLIYRRDSDAIIFALWNALGGVRGLKYSAQAGHCGRLGWVDERTVYGALRGRAGFSIGWGDAAQSPPSDFSA
jgi:hypothetical protein